MKLDSLAFRLDGTAVTTGDVMAASLVGGWLSALLADVEASRQGRRLAEERGLEATSDAIQEAFDQWRSDRDLIAAEELEAFLAAWDIELDDVVEHVERRLLNDLLGESELPDDAAEADSPDPEPLEVTLAAAPLEALLLGALEGLAERFALRCVAAPAADVDAARRAEARRWLLAEAGLESDTAFARLVAPFGVTPERAGWLLGREVDFRIAQQDILTQEAMRDVAREMAQELVRYEIVSAGFASEDAALEAVCCIREDRDPFLRAAARAGVGCREDAFLAEDLVHAPFGTRLASMRPRDLVGPARLEPDGPHVVAQLLRTLPADLADGDVLRRVEKRIVERALRRSVQERVRFPLGPASAA